MVSDKLIFVSCGQLTDEEKSLGLSVKAAIDATPGFEAYFAESVHDLEALGRNIFETLRLCSGAVVFLHERGTVLDALGSEWGHRSSVWVNQEIAILAYRQFLESQQLPVLVFKDERVKLEGAMTALIVNPLPIVEPAEVVKRVASWLEGQSFAMGSDDVFLKKWARLSDQSRKVVACLLDQGGDQVKQDAVRRALIDTFGVPRNEASTAVRKATLEFISTDLVKLIHNFQSGDELSVHPTWKFQLRRAVTQWRASES
ncbi:MAG: hypothetical protein ACREOH_09870 [Candidatus Entotheonellia bacterium]